MRQEDREIASMQYWNVSSGDSRSRCGRPARKQASNWPDIAYSVQRSVSACSRCGVLDDPLDCGHRLVEPPIEQQHPRVTDAHARIGPGQHVAYLIEPAPE